MSDALREPAAKYEPRGRLDPAGFERHVRFHTYAPPADLAPFITAFRQVLGKTPRQYKQGLSEVTRA